MLEQPLIKGGSFLFESRAPEEVFTREDISEEQQMFAAVAEEFMRKEVLPRAEQIYAKDWPVTRELLLKAGELDLLRIDIPESYGGMGLDKVSSAYVGEQIAVMPSFGASLGAHTTIGTLPIVYFGTPAQREKYLPKLATGEWIAAYCLTEPGSGSDALAAKTKATLSEDGTHYILRGQKMWITNGGFADVFIVFAKVDGEKFTAFIVDKGPGVVPGHEEKKLGLDGSSTTAVMLEDTKVPVENLLGEVGKGHVVAFNILNLGRLKLGSRNVGGMKFALNNAIAYSKERHQFNRAIADFGLIKRKLAEMAIRCYVGDALVWRTLGAVDRALENVDAADPMQALKAIEQYAVECSIIKVWSSEALAYVVDETVQVYGGYGYSKDYPAERAYRDARITRIYEGTNEINRMIIPTRLLKGAAKAQLPSLDEAVSDILDRTFTEPDGDGVLYVYRALSNVKEMAQLSLAAIAQAFGDKFSEEQEAVALTADIVAEAFAIESALLRTEKLIANKGESNCRIAVEMVRTYASDALSRAAVNAGNLAAALDEPRRLRDAFERLSMQRPINTVAARRRIAEAMIEAGRYLW
ncbi:MAG TPA: acyl-CoA dehydrogenase family protein [Blastocatellia bacterium]|nr:acyl-CoA dehydrogenase family protein [Blastocatellia bacterium]HMZ17219.1 acyl-CoA dehydrogenase family protein [Blastocatellia bacterium]HNG29650.1 acyl-CoA dehydrogenase family protein [Blastocatellia bacterium]